MADLEMLKFHEILKVYLRIKLKLRKPLGTRAVLISPYISHLPSSIRVDHSQIRRGDPNVDVGLRCPFEFRVAYRTNDIG